MKTILTATAIALTMFANAAPALDAGPHRVLGPDKKGQVSDFPPRIREDTDAQSTIRRMSAAGWRVRVNKCMDEQGRVCEVDFVNPCGVLAHATFLGQKLAGRMEVGGTIDGVNVRTTGHGDTRSIRTLPTPPCPDEAGD